jgi:hypothetical protein
MSTLSVSTINTRDNTTPLYISTGNTAVGMDFYPANGTLRIKASTIYKNSGELGSGKQTLWIPAAALIPRITNGPAAGQVSTTTNSVQVKTLDFDPGTIEAAQIQIKMPKHWDKGTITFSPVWSQLTTSAGAVSWNVRAVAISNSESIDGTFGTPVTLTSSGGTANNIYVGSESSAVTVAGSPQTDDLVVFEIGRFATGGSDTLAIDARLHGLNIYYTANTASDA